MQTANQPSKENVADFWNANPCGSQFFDQEPGSKGFYEALESFRYELEPHILEIVPFADFSEKDVLEIGVGVGIDGLQFARHGARYTGIDLTPTAIGLTSKAFETFGFQGNFQVADAEALPFEDNSFDLVYSHGVLHHTPKTEKAIDEIWRVLRPGGRAIVMLYHQRSYNYYVNIMFFRRFGQWVLRFEKAPEWISKLTGVDLQTLRKHQEKYRTEGKFNKDRLLSENTDGPGNPLSKVYTRKKASNLFQNFAEVYTKVHYLNKRYVPFIGSHLPKSIDSSLGRLVGWHLYIFARKASQ